MEKIEKTQAARMIQQADRITFLTGAGVSTASGIPDYRSLQGVYHGVEQPEYLLSDECLINEPDKFYRFVKHLYHPNAQPNIIHEKIAALERSKSVWTVSQNIDGLHRKAGSRQLVDFHGTLYHCYCRKCGQTVDWQEYLVSDRHTGCGGQLRPDIVLYGEGFSDETLQQAVEAVAAAELLVIVGTSFQVHPFCDLIYYRQANAQILAINQTEIYMDAPFSMVQSAGEAVFQLI